MKLAVAAAVLATSFWHLNPSSNELEFFVSGSKAHHFHACGFISVSDAGAFGYGVPFGYMADVLQSRGAKDSESQLFNTLDGAKAFVEKKCAAK